MTAAKVRAALMEQVGALDVYFEATIRILMPDAKPLREDVVRAILDEAKVEFTRIQKSAGPEPTWCAAAQRGASSDLPQ